MTDPYYSQKPETKTIDELKMWINLLSEQVTELGGTPAPRPQIVKPKIHVDPGSRFGTL